MKLDIFFFTCGKPQHDTVQGLQKIANHTSCYKKLEVPNMPGLSALCLMARAKSEPLDIFI